MATLQEMMSNQDLTEKLMGPIDEAVKKQQDLQDKRNQALIAMAENRMLGTQSIPLAGIQYSGIPDIQNKPYGPAEDLQKAQTGYYQAQTIKDLTPPKDQWKTIEVYDPTQKANALKLQNSVTGEIKDTNQLAKKAIPSEMNEYQKGMLAIAQDRINEQIQNDKDRLQVAADARDTKSALRDLTYHQKLAVSPMYNNLTAGSHTLQAAIEMFQKLGFSSNNPVDRVIATAKGATGQGDEGVFMNLMKNGQDIISRIRTGATLNKDEQQFYDEVFTPKMFNSKNVQEYKLKALYAIYQEALNRMENPMAPRADLREIYGQYDPSYATKEKQITTTSPTVLGSVVSDSATSPASNPASSGVAPVLFHYNAKTGAISK